MIGALSGMRNSPRVPRASTKRASIFLFAYDDPEDLTKGALMILSEDWTELTLYVYGHIEQADDGLILYDDYKDINVPFDFTDTEVEDGFEMVFQDGDVAEMHFVDQDTIIEDMNSIIDSLGE